MENNEISVRHMVENDIAFVYNVERKSFPYPFGQNLIHNIYIAAPELCLVLEHKEEVIGFLLGGYTSLPRQAHILSIAILQEYRGRGLGKKILNHFLNTINRLNYTSVKLEVNVDNHKAIKMYEEF
ncbi:MAG: GNAT family N-acetyltransferase, partial [Candidatus Thorarchaeota archaeon]